MPSNFRNFPFLTSFPSDPLHPRPPPSHLFPTGSGSTGHLVLSLKTKRCRLSAVSSSNFPPIIFDGFLAKSDRFSRTRSRHAKHLLLQWFGQQRLGYTARGIVLGGIQKPLETVFGSVCGVAIPNDDPAGPRLRRTKHAQGRTRRCMASWLLQI